MQKIYSTKSSNRKEQKEMLKEGLLFEGGLSKEALKGLEKGGNSHALNKSTKSKLSEASNETAIHGLKQFSEHAEIF